MSRNSLMPRLALVAALGLLGAAACDADDEVAPEGDDGIVEEMEEAPDEGMDEMDEEGDDYGAGDEAGDVVETVSVEAGEMYFEGIPETLPAGTVEFELNNAGDSPHDLAIEGIDDPIVIGEIGGGESDTGTVELEPGEYVVYCSVGSHREQGMEETVTVQ